MENKIDMKNIKKALEIADNLLCEYKNFASLLEGLARACKN